MIAINSFERQRQLLQSGRRLAGHLGSGSENWTASLTGPRLTLTWSTTLSCCPSGWTGPLPSLTTSLRWTGWSQHCVPLGKRGWLMTWNGTDSTVCEFLTCSCVCIQVKMLYILLLFIILLQSFYTLLLCRF